LEILSHGAAGAELTGAGPNDLIVNAEFRHACTLDPLREKVAHILAGHLRRQALEIIDRSILTAELFQELAHELVELLCAHRLAQHAEDHCAFVENDRL